MLTPLDIQQKKFHTGIGYEKKDVNTFIEEVVESYEQLYRNNAELQEEITTIKDELQHYKVREAELEKAKMLAEKDSEDKKTRASREAKNIELEAKNKAKSIVSDAEEKLIKMQDEMTLIESKYAAYKSEFALLLKKHFEFLKENDYDVDAMIDDKFVQAVSATVVAGSGAPAPSQDFGTYSGDPQMRDESTLGGMSASGGSSSDGKDLTKSDSSVYTSNLGSNENFVDPFNPDKKDDRFNPFDPDSIEKAKRNKPSTNFKVSTNPGEKNKAKHNNNSQKQKTGAGKSTTFKEVDVPTIKTNK